MIITGKPQQVFDRLAEYFDKKGQDKEFSLEVNEKESKSFRTRQQVRYYFGVVCKIISDYHGYNLIEINEILKTTFGKETFTGLSTKEFENIMTLIRQLWKEKFNVNIPKPNEEY